MPNNSFDPILQESETLRDAVMNAFTQAPMQIQRSSWVEIWGRFFAQHPWMSLVAAFLVVFFVTAIIRELICGYLKTNEILTRLKRLEEKLK